ncbi:MAG: RNA polymerase sigma factor [Ruminococcaceae bacterium]|nr:RNA polymerase sigma factor [Oscillospiraceae bacterium]
MDMAELNYSLLITRVLTGDTSAYDEIVEVLTQKMLRFAYSVCRDERKAEEAVEDAFVDCFLHLSTLKDPNAFEGWLCTAVKRKCWKLCSNGRLEDLSEFAEVLSDQNELPEDYLIRTEKESVVQAAVKGLSPALCEVTELYYFEGCGIEMIAERLHLPIGTVKRRLHDARIKLKRELIELMDTNTSQLEMAIKEKIQKIKNYRQLYGEDDTYKSSVLELSSMIEGVEDERKKKCYKAEHLTLMRFDSEEEKKQAKEELARAAEAGENPMLVWDYYYHKAFEIFHMGDDLPKKRAEYWEKTALPALEACKGLPGYEKAVGCLLVQTSRNISDYDFDKSIRLLEQASDYFDESDFEAVAIKNALQTYKESCKRSAMPDMGMYDRICRLGCTEKGLHMMHSIGGRIHWQQIIENHTYYPFFVSELTDQNDILLYANAKPGDVFNTRFEYSENRVATDTVSYLDENECVTVPAGTFENCTHVCKENVSTFRGKIIMDLWFKQGVGLLKYSYLFEDGDIETYELTEYEITGGTGLLPLSLGNRWVYRETGLPKILESRHEYCVARVSGEGEYYDLTHMGLTYLPKADDKGVNIPDSDVCLAIVDKLCDKWKLEAAHAYLRAAVRANTNEKAVATAIFSTSVIGKYADYQRRGYRFLPGSISSRNVKRENGCIAEVGGYDYCFGPYRYGWRGKYEDRIFGIKPFRYLDWFTNCYWNDEWKPGFKAEIPYSDYDNNGATVYLSVEDGGTVETPCGRFEDCIKLTFDAEMPGEREEHYYLNWNDGYAFQWCGKKEYWFAPGVGIVRHVCTWGNHISSEMILNSFEVPGSDGKEYLPVHIGTKWEYVETHLTKEGYRAAFCVSIPSGMDGTYQWISSQEFVYLDTEENYKNRFFGS